MLIAREENKIRHEEGKKDYNRGKTAVKKSFLKSRIGRGDLQHKQGDPHFYNKCHKKKENSFSWARKKGG